ncbi:MAG: shikimate dehydrogenase [Bacteroidia bacterium]|nr:shikimate dehydrogenase [Bacteroidia bacterium]
MPGKHLTHGLIGKKLGHSFSKKYFNEKFDKERIEARYELFELKDISEFPALWEKNPHLVGMNVTIPYKEEVMPFLDMVLPEAKAIGAVNTIKKSTQGLIGYNSDLWGFSDDLSEWFEGRARPIAATVLGTGGAARAVVYALKHLMGVEDCICLSRKGGRRFMDIEVCSYQDAMDLPDRYWKLVVNTTPVGMYPSIDQAPDIPYEKFQFHEESYVYDLVYNPFETKFMELAKKNGAQSRNGMGMLLGQAEKAWEFWTEFQL